MKINVTVDLEDFYSQSDELSFSEEIKQNISYQVKNLLWKDFKENALISFDSQVRRQIDLDKDLKIKETLDLLFKNKEVKKDYSGKMVSIEKYIESEMERHYFNNSAFDTKISVEISKQAADIVKKITDRYDLLFASQIVNNLNKAGMLKDDVANLLIDKQQ